MKGIQVEQIILLLIFVMVPLWRMVKNWLSQRAQSLAQQSEPMRSFTDQSQIETSDPFDWPPPEALPKPKPAVLTKAGKSSGQKAMNRKADKARAEARPKRKHIAKDAAPLPQTSLRRSVRYTLHDADRLKHAFALSVVLGPPRSLDPPQSDA